MVCNSKRERKSEIEYIEMLKSNKVAGIVLCTRTGELADILDGKKTDGEVVFKNIVKWRETTL